MDTIPEEQAPRHLKRVSHIKHIILSKYFAPWSVILGSAHRRLAYIDCYAGPGAYELDGEVVDGSPLIAYKAGREYVTSRSGRELSLAFVERDDATRSQLQARLAIEGVVPEGLRVSVLAEDASDFVSRLLSQDPNLVPSFFMIDPYDHPLSIPILNRILERNRTEALINFMYYQINRDLGNPNVEDRLDTMFGDREWRDQPFLGKSGREREEEFLAYFCAKISAKYKFPFRILFDVEDRVSRNRTKYYLIHASNHPKAVLLMKEVMWPLGDEEGVYQYGGVEQLSMFTATPTEARLRESLLSDFHNTEIGFDAIREATWRWPFIEKQYRSVIQSLEKEGKVTITRFSSKKTGLKGLDRVHFL